MNHDPNRGRTPPFSGLKAAWRQLVDALGGVSAIDRAGITRVGAARLSSYGLVHDSAFPPADVLYEVEAAIIAAGGRPEFLHAYADALGFVVVAKEAIEHPVETIDRAIGPVAQSVGEVMTMLGSAMADGVVTAKEAEEIGPAVRRATAEIHKLDEALDARARKAVRS